MKNYFKQHWKLLAITFVITMIILWLASSIGVAGSHGLTNSVISPLSGWVKKHPIAFVLYHLAIIAAIFVIWQSKVTNYLKSGGLTEKEGKFARYLCLLPIICILIMDWFMLRGL